MAGSIVRGSGWCALLACVLAAASAHGQATGRSGYAAVRIDGADSIGRHFALLPGVAGRRLALLRFAGAREAWIAACDDGARCDVRYRLGNAGGDPGWFPSLAMRPNGRPFGVFADPENATLVGVDCNDADCTNAVLRVLDDAATDVKGTALAVDPASGFPLVAYGAKAVGELRFVRCLDAGCGARENVRVDGGPNVGANPSLAIDGKGGTVIVHDDGLRGELKVATAPAGSNGFRNEVVASGSRGALLPRSAGLSLFFTSTGGALVHRACESADCVVGFDSVLTPDGLGGAPSPALDGSGRPVVAHRHVDTGAVYVSRCTDAACGAAERLQIDASEDAGRAIRLQVDAAGRPRAYWHSATRDALLGAGCTTLACTASSAPQVELNGPSTTLHAVATRADGSPVVVYHSGRFVRRLALCADPRCTGIRVVELPGDRGTTAAALRVRADGRPLAYYARFGGTVAYDCADAACTAGSLRPISPNDDTPTGQVAAALRPDGRPILVHVRRAPGGGLEWRGFVCATADCSAGQDRLLASAPATTLVSQSLSPRVAMGAGGRLLLLLALTEAGATTSRIVHVRCNDADCSATTVNELGDERVADAPLAVRADGRPVFRLSGLARPVLATCGDPDCTPAGVARVALPLPFGSANSLLLDADRPLFDRTLDRQSGIDRCADPACSAIGYVDLIGDPESPERVFLGQLAMDPLGRPVAAWHERTLGDLWLSVPPPDHLFANGFEP